LRKLSAFLYDKANEIRYTKFENSIFEVKKNLDRWKPEWVDQAKNG